MALLRIRKPDGEIVEIASLPGPQGPQGEKGDTGAQGPQGEKGDKGEKGDAGSIEFIVVTELPEEDTKNAIYLVLAADGAEGNAYDEYIYNNGAWEKIGSASVEVNLDEYVKKDYVDDNFVKQDETKDRCVYGRINRAEVAINLDYSNSAEVNSVPFRAMYGGIYIPSRSIGITGTAIPAGEEAVNKNYVDDLVASTKITLDTELSDTSENPVQNKVITAAMTQAAGVLEELQNGLSQGEQAIEYLATKVLPDVTAEDNGKLLQVVDGAWAAVAITNGNEVAY